MPPLALVPAAALLVCLLVVFRRRPASLPLLGAMAGLCFFALYGVFGVAPVQALAGQTHTCTVVVETDAETSFQEGRLRGTLRVQEMDGEPAAFVVYCEAFPGNTAGECFTAQFRMELLEENRYTMNYKSDGVFLQAEYAGAYQPLGDSGALRFALFRLRQRWAARLQRWLPSNLGQLESALLLGERADLSDAAQDAFRAAGVSHLLAVSGLHVALLCGVFTPGRRYRFQRPLILLRAALVLFYMLLTGLPVSVQRAGLVFLLALAGDFFLQPVDLLTSTGAVAVLLGLQNAYAPCDVGFQLSFCAVLGVQAAAALSRWEHVCLWPEKADTPFWLRKGLLAAANAVQVTVLATLATLPVLIAHGMTASGAGVLSNLLVVWMLRYLLLLGLAVLVLGTVPLLTPVAHLCSLVLALWLQVLLQVVTWCASLPLAHLYLPPRYTLLVLAVLGCLALVFRLARRMVWYLPASLVCTLAAVTLGVWAQRDVVTIALVGAANNPCAVCTQNGQTLVLFRGGESNLRAVREYLTGRGLPDIDLLVDLRQEPGTLSFGAGMLLTLEEQEEPFTSHAVLDDVVLDLYHKGSGNLAVLGIADRHVAVMAGHIQLEEPLLVDVFCAAGALSDSVQSNTVLCCTRGPAWLDQVEGEELLYGGEEPALVLRPGRSMTYEGVEQLALQ